MIDALFIVVSYLIGSVSFAVLVSRVLGLPDPRSYGSGNPGATNVLRTGRRAAALATLAGDTAKGAVAVLLARHVGAAYGVDAAGVAGCALAAFAGHLYPVFHGFLGGKGVATAAGVLLALDPWLGLGTLATWAIVAGFFRYVSLASIIAALFAPFWHVWLFGLNAGTAAMTAAVSAMALLLVWRHRANVGRLLRGEESRLGARSEAGSTS